jgi:GT2 family glycosyltransferase
VPLRSVDLSVVIPVRNGGRFIGDQLEAMARQDSEDPFEVVVADNGSTDDTVATVKAFAKRVPGLRLVDAGARRGSSYARNVGVANSRGSRIVFADADDVVDPGYVGALGRALMDHRAVAARIDWLLLNDWLSEASLPEDQSQGVSGGMFGWLPFAFGGAMGVRRDAFEKVGRFDESIARADDVEFCWRLALTGIPLTFVPEAVVHYRLRPSVWATFAQNRLNGREGPCLFKRYRREGMPRRSAKAAGRFWLGPLKVFARCRTRDDLLVCAALAGVRVGMLEGCFRYRVIYF